MKLLDLLMFAALSCLLLLIVREASAADLSCRIAQTDTTIIVSTPLRKYTHTTVTERGQTRTLHVQDTLIPSSVDDYVSYTDGKNRVTYWMDCERL